MANGSSARPIDRPIEVGEVFDHPAAPPVGGAVTVWQLLAPRALASRNRFFLCIRATDRQFERGRTQSFLQSLQAQRVVDVET